MYVPEQWIWLSKDVYSHRQVTKYSAFETREGNFTVAEFKREYTFDKKIKKAELRFSGDTVFVLYVNEKFMATGPATPGGDFLGNEKARPNYYAFETIMEPDTYNLDFFAVVKMMPIHICEYSKGHGGFMLSALITFEDGTKKLLLTDETWQARVNDAYRDASIYNNDIQLDDFSFASITDNIWHTKTAPLALRAEEEIKPLENNLIALLPYEEKEVVLKLDRIYAGFIHILAKTKGMLHAEVFCREIDEMGTKEEFTFAHDDEYRGFIMHSAGGFCVKLKNESDTVSEISVSLIATYYPIYDTAITETSDEELNAVLDVCRHTLKICRQLHHLDSPRHCEPLACTGDYYIEALMTATSFGDLSLAEFDIERTAELLRNNDGRMFHTTYSLIWVFMLRDVYFFTGNKKLLLENMDALMLLLNRFETYLGDNGLIETPPDYMFVDWIYIDGLSMHHPPKALGQTCLNMFYYGALCAADVIFRELGENAMAEECIKKSIAVKNAIHLHLYDKEKKIYFEGLNTPTPEELLYEFMPQNVEKRYYLKHANILSVYFDICDDPQTMIDKIMTDEIKGDYQPYFGHYLLEAIYKNGLRDRYTLMLLEKWKTPVLECRAGLTEGFVKPEPSYCFDHSHAWAGSPLYSLTKALLGFEIIKPGMKEIKFAPSLLGLAFAKTELPTPFGKIVCHMEEGKEPMVSYPKTIDVHM